MSAPETNTKKEQRRHRPALVGIAVSLAFAALAALVVALFVGLPADEQATPVPTEPQESGVTPQSD